MAAPTISSATRLGPYEILAPLGAGGMGHVYRAKDTRLDRDVAIKVLTPELAHNETFRSRFKREARAISALNHPHICALYDVGQAALDGSEVHYLVLELLDGESLATRVARGAMPIEQVLRYGIQIAAALDAAHRRGIIHRDLKPGNVMLTRGGAKLLDFGLARPSNEPAVADSSAETAPGDPLTTPGAILGTLGYMAPEQVHGATADARTDIFALGVLLYEMATGRKAFEGKTPASVIAAILSSQPAPLSQARPTAPAALDHVIGNCLEKDADDRWQSARDVMSELQWIAERGLQIGGPAVLTRQAHTRERLAWIGFAIASVVAVSALARAWRSPGSLQVVRFTITFPDEFKEVGPPVLSPDGHLLAFNIRDPDRQKQIWVRPIDTLEARPLPGTEGGRRAFWSPDSRHLAFMAGGKLKTADVAGGPVLTICDAPTGSDGTWGSAGVILFDGLPGDPIWKVDAKGGVTHRLVEPDPAKGIAETGWPEWLPDGRHFLYIAKSVRPSDWTLMVSSIDSVETRVLFPISSQVLFSPPGYLVYRRDRALVAQRFDSRTLEVRGEPALVDSHVEVTEPSGRMNVSVAESALAYQSGDVPLRRLVWVDRSGRESSALPDLAQYGDVSFSPDGTRMVVAITEPRSGTDLWIRDLQRGSTSRFTSEPGEEGIPVWSRDGTRIAFGSTRSGNAADLYLRPASGVGNEELLYHSAEQKWPTDWSPDGRHLLYFTASPSGYGLWALPLEGDRKPFAVAVSKFNAIVGTFSPDGRYVAYESDESGRFEIYVQDFPQPRAKRQISTAGGRTPFWRRDGREMFYLSPRFEIMAVPIELRPSFSAGTPNPLFAARLAGASVRARYNPTPDGQRFLLLEPGGLTALPVTTVVVNWLAALRQ
jgi:Tol biopolymer transport system component